MFANLSMSLKDELRTAFPKMREGESLARYTSSRIGGPAEWLLEIHSAEELAGAAEWFWSHKLSFQVLGGGSNVLISDKGLAGVTLLNHARSIDFQSEAANLVVWAESGANFGAISRQAAAKNLGGLEWAAGIPGTLGGAIVGNAGAHGGDMSHVLIKAQVLHRVEGRQNLAMSDLGFEYRTSQLKSQLEEVIILSASLQLIEDVEEKIQEKMDAYLAHRRTSQPPGASMGSMFKNPANDFAGRLIEAAGLKGTRIGDAQISPLHGNFFLNLGDARAADVHALIMQAQKEVHAKFDIKLELEIILLGEW